MLVCFTYYVGVLTTGHNRANLNITKLDCILDKITK